MALQLSDAICIWFLTGPRIHSEKNYISLTFTRVFCNMSKNNQANTIITQWFSVRFLPNVSLMFFHKAARLIQPMCGRRLSDTLYWGRPAARASLLRGSKELSFQVLLKLDACVFQGVRFDCLFGSIPGTGAGQICSLGKSRSQ